MIITRRSLLNMMVATPTAYALTGLLPARATQGGVGAKPGLYQFHLGDAKVTALLDGHLPVQPDIINGYDAALATAALRDGGYPVNDGGLSIPINGYLIEQGGEVILIDTGAAQMMGPGAGGLLAALAAAGITPEQVTKILLTHLHLDHVGGLLDAEGGAMFPNAEVAVSEVEWQFWHDDGIMAGVPAQFQDFFRVARSSVAPYQDRLIRFSGEGEVAPGILSVEMPGHTPGHSGFQLNAGSESLLIWGDLVHSTALQFAYPEWTLSFDTDPVLTVQSRKRLLDRAAADNLLVAGMHLDFPGLGRVARTKDAYRYQQAPWQALL